MVLSILIAIVSAPALLGTQEAIRQSQSKEKREEHRARRCNLIASCVKSSLRSREINGRPLVLKNGKLWIDTGTSDGLPYGHQYAGYYLPYPDTKYEGLVTTITDEAPIMNWVYVDKETYEVKYGVRLDAQPNLTGPFDCTRQDRRLTFDGWEGWCAVEEFPTLWAVYFDVDDDGLKSKIPPGTRVLDIEVSRKEKRWKKEASERQQDQTTKRAVDAKEDAPTDQPVTAEPQLDPPGNTDSVPPSERFKIPKSIFQDGSERFKLPSSIFTDGPQPQVPESDIPPPPKTPPPAYTSTFKAPSPPPSNATAPKRSSSTSPPTKSQSTPTSEKRTTPKLNRNSGTRALAQAQIFEALALGQYNNNDIPFGNGKSSSRPPSNADSASDYSGGRLSVDILGMYVDGPESAELRGIHGLSAAATATQGQSDIIQQQPQASLQVSDPAVFGREPLPRLGSPSRSSDGRNAQYRLQRQNPFEANPDRETRNRSPEREVRKPTLSDKRPIGPSDKARTGSSEQLRPNVTREGSRNVVRSTSRTSSKRFSPPPRQRSGTTSSQNDEASLSGPISRPLARTSTTPGRKSMASTMSSGTGNRGMAYRIGSGSGSGSGSTGPLSPPEMPRSRTNSSLYREIDEMVGGGRSRPGATGTSTGRLRNSRDDERAPPVRRAATTRTPMREGGGARTPDDRLGGANRGYVRRGEREPGERQ